MSEKTETNSGEQTAKPTWNIDVILKINKKNIGRWRCPTCFIYNDDKQKKCLSCEIARPESAVTLTRQSILESYGIKEDTKVDDDESVEKNGSSPKPTIKRVMEDDDSNKRTKLSIDLSKPIEKPAFLCAPKQTDLVKTPPVQPTGGFQFAAPISNFSFGVSKSASSSVSPFPSFKVNGPITFGVKPMAKTPSTPKIEESPIEVFKPDSVDLDESIPIILPCKSLSISVPVNKSEKACHVFVFGSGEVGQLGVGDDISLSEVAIPVKSLETKHIVRIACGGQHNIALSDDKQGTMYSWGVNDEMALGRDGDELDPYEVERGEIPADEKVIQVYAGSNHSVALTDKHKVYTWGTYRDNNGLLGWDLHTKIQNTPKQVKFEGKCEIVSICCGENHTMALDSRGNMYTWGAGDNGQLGRRLVRPREPASLIPRHIAIKEGRRFAKIAAIFSGGMHAMAISECGKVYTWGLNNWGQLGTGNKENTCSPVHIKELDGKHIVAMAGGQHHTLALSEDGVVYACGRGSYGQLGFGPNDEKNKIQNFDPAGEKLFRTIPGLSEIKVQQIACGSCHSLCLSSRGIVYVWGFGELGQCGNDALTDNTVPKAIVNTNIKGIKVSQLGGGGQHSALIGIPL
ncbi:hypothetical protein WA158_004278 [Blastocystis sp. Blastoise]